MKDVGEKLKEARVKKNLTINEVSDFTYIRAHILTAIENGVTTILPEPYLKAFIKTYAEFLEFSPNDIEEFLQLGMKPEKQAAPESESVVDVPQEDNIPKRRTEPVKKTAEPLKPITKKAYQPKTVKTEKKSEFIDILKPQKQKKFQFSSISNYFIYVGIAVFVLGMLYVTIFYDSKSPLPTAYKPEEEAKSDTAVLKPESNKLLSFFESPKPDSIILVGKAKDTAWLKLDLDGVRSEEILLLPGMERRWSAKKYILLSQGNSGAVDFSRNENPLPQFGRPGTVVKNIRITMDTVIFSPFGAQTDSVRRERRKKREAEPQTPREIMPSAIESPKPLINPVNIRETQEQKKPN